MSLLPRVCKNFLDARKRAALCSHQLRGGGYSIRACGQVGGVISELDIGDLFGDLVVADFDHLAGVSAESGKKTPHPFPVAEKHLSLLYPNM